MYTHYFGLTDKPFAIAPNPQYLYMSELHREALAHLLYGISSEGCIILLTGDVGTGKTTVCRSLISQLPATTEIALILNPKLTIIDLFKTICEELKIPIEGDSPSTKTYIDKINSYLLDAHSQGKNTALIIDEAQNLDLEILEQLRLLTNLETNTHKLLQIVLIGQPELREILQDPKLSQINQRITTRYHLEPLQIQDIDAYIKHRVLVAGGNPRIPLFSDKAIRYVARLSNGIPRLINVLCDRALLGAYAQNRDHVSLDIMKKAAVEVKPGVGSKSSGKSKVIFALLALFFAISLPALFLFTDLGDNFSLLKNNLSHLQQLIRPSPEKTAMQSTTIADTAKPAQTGNESNPSPTTNTGPAEKN
ncbi:MAG: ExeA family protein [Desulforhopalus sp.]